jgi:hypothetical protein
MKTMVKGLALALATGGAMVPGATLAQKQAAETTRTEPEVGRPLAWLIAAQNDDGGWGDGVKTAPDVATTAISGIALVRMGDTYSSGQHQEATRRAVDYVVRAVERTSQQEIDINPPGTLPQRKLGRHIDTFLGAQFLGEVLPGMPQGKARARVAAALDNCIAKIYRAQREDGGYASDGWAPVLSSAFAQNGLYRAREAGETVRPEAIARGDNYMMHNYDDKTKAFRTSESAGVGLYTVAGTAQSAARQGKMDAPAAKAALSRLNDERFLRGFGSYGGEEHVSFMMTSEALAQVGGKEWDKWNRAIRIRLANIQRQDGTWRGDHCITSTSFCTAASLITLAISPKNTKHS